MKRLDDLLDAVEAMHDAMCRMQREIPRGSCANRVQDDLERAGRSIQAVRSEVSALDAIIFSSLKGKQQESPR